MDTLYHSTRALDDAVTSKQAIAAGIAPDGGLYVSDGVFAEPLDLHAMVEGDYASRARMVLGRLLPDFTADEIAGAVAEAYGSFDRPAEGDGATITPLTPLGADHLLELWHGPTSAFKDVALQMLPRLMARSLSEGDPRVMIVCATSGDTGKAALEGFSGVEGCAVTVFYPEGGVSDIQYLQMACQEGDNVAVCAVKGNFDDAQTEVKAIFADKDMAARLAADGIRLSSANSINVGRLVPQVVYYFDAYAQLVAEGAVQEGEPVDFYVPTGNFGDVLAGYYAKLLGLPVGELVVCSNENDVLFDFLNTGVYDKRRDFHRTISPSMDILVSSNLERLLYLASDGDTDFVARSMADLAEKGVYEVPAPVMERIRETFRGTRATEDDVRATIAKAWTDHGVVLDPHTAVAVHGLWTSDDGGRPRVVLSTANPHKFAEDVLGQVEPGCGAKGFEAMDTLASHTGVAAPPRLSALRDATVRFEDVVERDAMGAYVEERAETLLAGNR